MRLLLASTAQKEKWTRNFGFGRRSSRSSHLCAKKLMNSPSSSKVRAHYQAEIHHKRQETEKGQSNRHLNLYTLKNNGQNAFDTGDYKLWIHVKKISFLCAPSRFSYQPQNWLNCFATRLEFYFPANYHPR